jgi:UDP-N-acetylglucosamine 1-carboxyvinyltransferase
MGEKKLEKLQITGGVSLKGTVKVSGAKNAALALLAGAILAKGESIIENIPRIADIDVLVDIIKSLGGKVKWLERNTVSIIIPEDISCVPPFHLVSKLRASNLLLGALLARCGQAEISMPGGCNIGSRPMDLHFKGLIALGAKIELDHGNIKAFGQLKGNKIYLDFPSVGATENIMMAAVRAQGTTIIENVAKEPEIVDLANFLNSMGAKVRGAGTDVIRIEGANELKGTRYSVIPDRIEAGTMMIAGAITGGHVVVQNIISAHLQPIIAKLIEAGVEVIEREEEIEVKSQGKILPTDIKTMPYPGYPTDMQSQMMALLSIAEGTSVVVETVYENRLRVAEELQRMGAKVKIEGQTAVVYGSTTLCGANVSACDLRSGAALVVAALNAKGDTIISNVHLIDRGYENLEEKLRSLGAKITRVYE